MYAVLWRPKTHKIEHIKMKALAENSKDRKRGRTFRERFFDFSPDVHLGFYLHMAS